MPDQHGNFKGIATPAAAEHLYTVHDDGDRFYFSCRCGACGKKYKKHATAEREGELHVQWCREERR